MSTGIDELLAIMARLRDPEDGCPWDREQDFASIAPYTIEEAYEVDHAIRSGDRGALLDELGDLLFQVVYHAQMAREEGAFGFEDVVAGICEKLVRRHPHVFGDASVAATAGEQRQRWEDYKRAERDERAGGHEPDVFAGVPTALPALARASKVQQRAEKHSEAVAAATAPDAGAREAAAGALRALAGGHADSRVIARLLYALVERGREEGVDVERALADLTQEHMDRARSHRDRE